MEAITAEEVDRAVVQTLRVNRIEAGEPCELHYPDGRVFQITGKEQ
jgi:hypothetical protein